MWNPAPPFLVVLTGVVAGEGFEIKGVALKNDWSVAVDCVSIQRRERFNYEVRVVCLLVSDCRSVTLGRRRDHTPPSTTTT